MWSVEEYGYLNALVDSMVLNDPADGLSRVGDGNVHSLLNMAIQIEKDTILFYTELHAMVGEDDGGTISAIIREEKQHLKTLTEARAAAG
jgi:hypothetical protein